VKSRVSGIESAALNLRIKELASQGMGSKEIGDKLGYHARMIAARVTRMRREQEIPPTLECRSDRDTRTKLRNLCQKFDRNLGRMTQVMEGLSDEQVLWLYRETPEGSTIADFVVALIRDAYDEDTRNGQG